MGAMASQRLKERLYCRSMSMSGCLRSWGFQEHSKALFSERLNDLKLNLQRFREPVHEDVIVWHGFEIRWLADEVCIWQIQLSQRAVGLLALQVAAILQVAAWNISVELSQMQNQSLTIPYGMVPFKVFTSASCQPSPWKTDVVSLWSETWRQRINLRNGRYWFWSHKRRLATKSNGGFFEYASTRIKKRASEKVKRQLSLWNYVSPGSPCILPCRRKNAVIHLGLMGTEGGRKEVWASFSFSCGSFWYLGMSENGVYPQWNSHFS